MNASVLIAFCFMTVTSVHANQYEWLFSSPKIQSNEQEARPAAIEVRPEKSAVIHVADPVNDGISPSKRIQSDAPEIIELAESLTRNLRSDYEKSVAVHKWISSNIVFDEVIGQKMSNGTYNSAVEYSQDALTTLRTGTAVCEGFSNLAAALLRASGIPTKVSYGKFYYFKAKVFPTLKRLNRLPDVRTAARLHGWNEILIDGKWMPMDVTSDAGGFEEFVSDARWIKNNQTEFLNPDLEYFNATHFKMGEMNQ